MYVQNRQKKQNLNKLNYSKTVENIKHESILSQLVFWFPF